MSKTYQCIGGPLDGQTRAVNNDCPYLYVAEQPAAPSHYRKRHQRPEPLHVITHLYRLCEVTDGGLAWVHQP